MLSPAGSAAIGIEAIKHGADAVYIGASSHGARKAAANSLDDIRLLADFSYIYGARVYVTVNTLVYDKEIKQVETLIRNLYEIGVDALIVQDMGILRMDIPPIALHASTQCDIRTPEKARFLQEAGFSQLVLARELSIKEIKAICEAVSIPVEVFIHGALCVSYSGRCSAGFLCAGRSGNRGECPQICRQAFTLTDADGKVIAREKYLLSLKDFSAESHIGELIEAGVRSFKIEGRLKEAGYVKNVTAYYSRLIDREINRLNRNSNDEPIYRRESFGKVDLRFVPQLDKSFNRGFTDYRLSGNVDKNGIAQILTPKSLGEKITGIGDLKPGDGVSFFTRQGEYMGINVNGIKNGKIIGNRPVKIPADAELRRTSSVEWKKLMVAESAVRKIPVEIELDASGVCATSPTASVRLEHTMEAAPAENKQDHGNVFKKLGNTPFELSGFTDNELDSFYPVSYLTSLRRELIQKLLDKIRASHVRAERRKETPGFPYLKRELDYAENVANMKAEQFYRDHGVEKISSALETAKDIKRKNEEAIIVMASRHCVLRELKLCLRNSREGSSLRQPLRLTTGPHTFRLAFDCNSCEMRLLQ